jgi:hypothetical protein
VLAVLSSCADDSSDVPVAAPGSTVASTSGPSTSGPSTSGPSTTILSAAPPDDIVSASPFRYRLDWAAGVFQVRLHNGGPVPLAIRGVQFVWDGLTTPVAERHDTVVPGLTLDFPVAVAPATCHERMPDLGDAVVRLTLDGGTVLDVPVFDVDGVAQQLYLDDCERQMIESQVTIEWADLHDEQFEGRTVTGGSIRLRRGEASGEVRLLSVGNTILFVVDTPGSRPGQPTATLPVGEDEVAVPVRILENRCDSHARSESSQSFRFFGEVDLGDGVARQYTILPTPDDQVQIRARFEAGCDALGDTGFVGQADE